MDVSDLRGWIDYDRDRLPPLSADQRIDYFEKRVRLVVVNPLRRILDTEIMIPESSALLIFGVSLCCAIEATGKFVNGGRGRNHERFKSFLRRYMWEGFHKRTINGMTYGDALWKHFRNGLAHGFVVCHGGFEGAATEPYSKVRIIAGHRSLDINPTRLYDDYVAGFERYLTELRGAARSSRRRRNFNSVFIKVFIRGE